MEELLPIPPFFLEGKDSLSSSEETSGSCLWEESFILEMKSKTIRNMHPRHATRLTDTKASLPATQCRVQARPRRCCVRHHTGLPMSNSHDNHPSINVVSQWCRNSIIISSHRYQPSAHTRHVARACRFAAAHKLCHQHRQARRCDCSEFQREPPLRCTLPRLLRAQAGWVPFLRSSHSSSVSSALLGFKNSSRRPVWFARPWITFVAVWNGFYEAVECSSWLCALRSRSSVACIAFGNWEWWSRL